MRSCSLPLTARAKRSKGIAQTVERIIGENGGFDIVRARSKDEEDKLWDVRRAISPSLMKYGTLKINEDVVVPRSRVPELIAKIEAIGKQPQHVRRQFWPRGRREHSCQLRR